jgi:2'-5' RNA ligase
MPRLFVCAWPPAHVVDLLEQLPRPAADGVRWVDPETWHITLRFVGDADLDDLVERLGRADLPTATLTLGPVVDLLSDRHVVVPVSGADALALAVRSATAGIGERDPPRFRGHLTLARADRDVAGRLVGAPITAQFRVREVALVASDLQPGGPAYSTVAVFDTV